MAANGPTRGPRKKKNLRQGLFLFAQKVMGPCQRVGTWTAKGGYANWCHDLLCSPLLAAACDERRLEWFRGPEWCAIDAACRAGDGNHARGAQASEPGPTWTHQRFGLIAWDKHIYLREPTRFDHARSGLVWLQGMASLFSVRSRADRLEFFHP
ncbi:hypothetical protein V8C43DRAFT_281111 [Trichoderma afarasin]